MPHDPGMMASFLGAASALLALCAMVRIACIDLRCLEIDPDWAALAGSAALGALVAVEGRGAVIGAVVAASLTAGAAWIAARLRPGAIGQGDVVLFAVVGLVAGPRFLAPVLVIGAAFCLASCVAYGLARGKRPKRVFRHMVPAGPPLMAALAPVFAWRIAAAIWPDLILEEALPVAFLAIAGPAALAAALVAGALPMAVRRRAAPATPCGSRSRVNQAKEN